MLKPKDLLMSTTLTKSINDLKIGQLAIIKYSSNVSLNELGFLSGEHVKVIARAAFNGPTAVRVGTSVFALRKEEAETIRVYNVLHDKRS